MWPTEDSDTRTQVDVSVSGRLDLVDLRRARFRIRDAVGNDIVLLKVANIDEAARLVGQSVTALGEGDLGARGQIVAVTGAIVTATGVLAWIPPVVAVGATSPPADGLTGVTAAEVDEFLASIQE